MAKIILALSNVSPLDKENSPRKRADMESITHRRILPGLEGGGEEGRDGKEGGRREIGRKGGR